jgi:hypothetical protein
MIEWATAYFTRQRSVRLITYQDRVVIGRRSLWCVFARDQRDCSTASMTCGAASEAG